MNLLLHTCCAPCLLYPLERLSAGGLRVSALFYNPNIHPFAEYKKRKSALEDFFKAKGIEIIFAEYRPSEFFQAVNLIEEKPQRCLACWSLRLNRTAQIAKEKGFESFSTTLLASPYQDQEALKKIGSDISRDKQIEFFYEDFRPGFRKAHDLAKQAGIYCQKYCGCVYSEIERYRS